MNEIIDDCDKCPYYERFGIGNFDGNCEIFNGSFEEFIEKCPQMNDGKIPEERKGA